MDDEGRLEMRNWDTLEKSLKDHPRLKFMSVLAQRAAVILKRNTAFFENKVAFTERCHFSKECGLCRLKHCNLGA